MTTGSIRLGTYAGIPVRAHWSMALVALLFGVNLSAQFGAAPGIVATIAFFASILAHEFGHALVARRYGVQTQSIDLWALGGVAHLDREPPTPRAEGLIAVAGPAVSLAIGVAALGVGIAMQSDVFGLIGVVNLLLAVFNMLPGAPLDGGRVLRAVRWARTGDKYRAMREAGNAGRLLGWLMVGGGVVLMLNGQFGVFIIITGLFIAISAKSEIMASHMGERLDGITVGDLTWFGIAEAGTDMDADSMLWQRQRLGNAGAVAVLDDDGRARRPRPGGPTLGDPVRAAPHGHAHPAHGAVRQTGEGISRRGTVRRAPPAEPAAARGDGVERRQAARHRATQATRGAPEAGTAQRLARPRLSWPGPAQTR